MKEAIQEGRVDQLSGAFNIAFPGGGYHLSIVVPIHVVDNSGVFHAIEHLIVTHSDLMRLSQELHVENFSAKTSPACVEFAFSSGCKDCFRSFTKHLLTAVFYSKFTIVDFEREVYRTHAGGHKTPGVIINEMHRSSSAEQRQIALAIRKFSLAGSSYGFNSGGVPEEIYGISFLSLLEQYAACFVPARSTLITVMDGEYDEFQAFVSSILCELAVAQFDCRGSVANNVKTINPLKRNNTGHIYSAKDDDASLWCKVWRYEGEIDYYTRIKLGIALKYAFGHSDLGLFRKLRQLPGAQGLAGFNGFESKFPIPLMVVTLRLGALMTHDIERYIDESLQDICDQEVDADYMETVANSLLEAPPLDFMTGETRGRQLLGDLRVHLELGYEPGELALLGSHVEHALDFFLIAGNLGTFLREHLGHRCSSSLIELSSVRMNRPEPLAEDIPYQDQVSRSTKANEVIRCSAILPGSGASAAPSTSSKEVVHAFQIRYFPGLKNEQQIFLPLFSKYATDIQYTTRQGGDLGRRPAGSNSINNTFFRVDPGRSQRCFSYNQFYSRYLESEKSYFDQHLIYWFENLRKIDKGRFVRSWKEFVAERKTALGKHGLALACVQAASASSQESARKTQSTGLECFEWIENVELFNNLVDEVLPDIFNALQRSGVWGLEIREDFPMQVRSHYSPGGSDFSGLPEAHAGAGPLPGVVRELWLCNVSYSTVVVSIPVKSFARRDILSIRIAEIMISRCEFMSAMRDRGSYSSGVKYNEAEGVFQFYSDVTFYPEMDLELMMMSCISYLHSVRDENIVADVARELTRQRIALTRVPDEALSKHLISIFGSSENSSWDDFTVEDIDVQQFSYGMDGVLDLSNPSIVIISDRVLPSVVAKYQLRVREII
ncbi:hypothetical protein [Luteimonas sp. FCS-9]|uniref:hypothetical protein n=1 Tax=Luteimonas sp. FCS-9 TaxID=1547516 RepID=UPI000ABA5ACB|nr:hypothetical protein [Luteimonas sp. FCS-9]